MAKSNTHYIIMAAGEGKRWNNYLGVPKHLVNINGETLLQRTVRLLKNNNVNNIYITSSDERYDVDGAIRYKPQNNEFEIDRFLCCEEIWSNKCTVFLYGDCYYTDEAIKTIVNSKCNGYHYYGRLTGNDVKKYGEIFAVKIKNTEKFKNACLIIRNGLKDGTVNRGLGWETYKILEGKNPNMTPTEFREWIKSEHKNFVVIDDDTEDFDTPEDYEKKISSLKKKIIFRVPKIYMGGTNKALLNTLQRIHKDYDVFIHTDGVKDHYIASELSKYATIKNDLHCDVLVYTNPYDKRQDIIFKRDRPLIWCHTCVNEIYPKPRRALLNGEYITVSKEAQRQLLEKGKKSEVIDNYVDINIEELANKDIYIDDSYLILVTVSRLTEQKGINEIGRLAGVLIQKGIKFKWYIIGEPKPSWRIDDCVFLGKVDNPYPYIKRADYLVQLSKYESDCLVLTEAWSLGTPVIVTEWDGVYDKVIHGIDGYVLPKEFMDIDINYFIKPLKVQKTVNNCTDKWTKILNTNSRDSIIKSDTSKELTIYTIIYNNYGHFLNEWVLSIARQRINIGMVVVLGKNHGLEIDNVKYFEELGVKFLYNEDEIIMGKLYNQALKYIKTEWVFKLDVDDTLHENFSDEFLDKKSDYDSIILKYFEYYNNNVVSKKSAKITVENMLHWRQNPVPGYIVCKRKYDNKVLLYEEVEVPNYPYLFQIATLNFNATHSDKECVNYRRRKGSHGDLALGNDSLKIYGKFVDKRAEYYFDKCMPDDVKMDVQVIKEFRDHSLWDKKEDIEVAIRKGKLKRKVGDIIIGISGKRYKELFRHNLVNIIKTYK